VVRIGNNLQTLKLQLELAGKVHQKLNIESIVSLNENGLQECVTKKKNPNKKNLKKKNLSQSRWLTRQTRPTS